MKSNLQRRKLKERTVKIQIEVPVFAYRMRKLRIKAGMTQKQLGEKLGICRVQVANIELGNTSTTIDKIMLLCDLFDVTPNDLLL